LKKIKLRKQKSSEPAKRIGYKIDYASQLNPAQYEAVMHNNGAALVIAGAGTGKTRTLTYRVARLIEDGVPPQSILLLTFTRKAASEMLRRASIMLDGRAEKVAGGTFHSFALRILYKYAKMIGYAENFNVLDQADAEDTINLLRGAMNIKTKKKRFPQKKTLNKIFSLAANTRSDIEDIINEQYPLFVEQMETIEALYHKYMNYKKQYNLMDYDDMLLNLLELLKNHKAVLRETNDRFKYVMVDEYQDTNRLQHEIVLLLAGQKENIMAVGDDAQSIYSFRGADYQNILFFPESFSDCKIYKIEENYRSTQPVLDLSNRIIADAAFKYEKELFTRRTDGELPWLVSCGSERQQSEFIVQQALDLREEGMPMGEIAVLFRSGFHSFDLEISLEQANIPYQKFGGMKFIETAHIKDLIAYMKVLFNPRDAISLQRILLLLDGVGPGTARKVIDMADESNGRPDTRSLKRGRENIDELFGLIQDLRAEKISVGEKAEAFSEYYKPLLKNKYDDWQKRWKDIETFLSIAERYRSINSFLNDMAIDPPVESLAELTPEAKEEEYLTLSTIHSAKGLEWKCVFILNALEGRFPSARSAESIDTLEEERRLFYVAATRAKDRLFIAHPTNIYDRESGFVLSEPSRFIEGAGEDKIEKFVLVEDDEDEESDELLN
jgi:DNA helicase-2/ATP-dependent DNA helicase PcrA